MGGRSDLIGRPPVRLSTPLRRSAAYGGARRRPCRAARAADRPAPLFPPASLALPDALAEDRARAGSADAFMLARFVCPASRLAELPRRRARRSASCSTAAAGRLRASRPSRCRWSRRSRCAVDPRSEVYVEVPLDDALDAAARRARGAGLRAKVRCGGASVPSDEELARFVRSCRERGLVFKATAGLHHAVRDDGEHGFLNLLAAVVFGDEERRSSEADPAAFALDADAFRWRERAADRATSSPGAPASACTRSAAAASSSPSRSSRRSGCCRCDRRGRLRRLLASTATRLGSASASGSGILDLAANGLGSVFASREPEPVPRARPVGLGGHRSRASTSSSARARSSSRSRTRRRSSRSTVGRLRRLLLLARARDEPRAPLPAGRGAAAAELAAPSGRLPRPRGHGRRQRDARRAALRPVEGARRCRAPVRRRAGASTSSSSSASSSGSAAGSGEPVPGVGVSRPRLRRRARQRLERAGHPGLGVPAARARSSGSRSRPRSRRG